MAAAAARGVTLPGGRPHKRGTQGTRPPRAEQSLHQRWPWGFGAGRAMAGLASRHYCDPLLWALTAPEKLCDMSTSGSPPAAKKHWSRNIATRTAGFSTMAYSIAQPHPGLDCLVPCFSKSHSGPPVALTPIKFRGRRRPPLAGASPRGCASAVGRLTPRPVIPLLVHVRDDETRMSTSGRSSLAGTGRSGDEPFRGGKSKGARKVGCQLHVPLEAWRLITAGRLRDG